MYDQIEANKRKTWLLIGLFVGVLLLIGWAFYQYTGEPVSVSLAAVIAIAMALFSYYAGDAVALRLSGAKPADPQRDAYVVRMVENLAITAGLPMPKVYIISDPAINAFATGRDPQHASVAVTSGAIEGLENEELEGVLAHELSHVANYDIRLMTVVIVLVGLASLLSDWFVRMSWYGRGSRGSDRGGRGGGAQGALALIGLIFLILAPIIAKLIQLAVSRRREFLADASGALLTRYPEGLAKALEKIGAGNARPMRHAHEATAHLYISSPFGAGRRLTKLFSTHPPLAERIAALRQMA